MKTTDFMMCCGVRCIYDLNRVDFDWVYNEDPERFRKDLKSKEKNGGAKGMTLMVLTSAQVSCFKKVVEEEGYTCLADGFFNPRHNTKLSLYGKIFKKEKYGRKRHKSSNEKVLKELWGIED